MSAVLCKILLKIFQIQNTNTQLYFVFLKIQKDVRNLAVNSGRHQIVNNNHLFINLCSILNYVVVNSDIQESIYDAFRLECINLP